MNQAGLHSEYTAALVDSLQGADEAALARGYELGRRALVHGLGVLDMAALSHQALLEILREKRLSQEGLTVLESARNLFAEALTPFEMTHRGYQETNVALRRLNESLEEGVKRIAHVLHGEAAQLLAVVYIALDDLSRDLPPGERKKIQKVREFLDQIEADLRRLSHELHPTVLDDLGLTPALEFLAKGVSQRTGLAVRVESDLTGRLPGAVEMALYRIVQEAVNNASKHARARQVKVQVRREPRQIRCSVRDDGAGFDVSEALARKGERGLGFIGIRERLNTLGGTVEISSQPGSGTEVSVSIPLKD